VAYQRSSSTVAGEDGISRGKARFVEGVAVHLRISNVPQINGSMRKNGICMFHLLCPLKKIDFNEFYGAFKPGRRVHTIFGVKIHCVAGSQGNTAIIPISLLGTHSRSGSRLLLKLLVLKFLMLEAFLKQIKSFLKERKWISHIRCVLEGLDKAGECLCGIAEEVSTCDAMAFRDMLAMQA
jgi:hypothetical protein